MRQRAHADRVAETVDEPSVPAERDPHPGLLETTRIRFAFVAQHVESTGEHDGRRERVQVGCEQACGETSNVDPARSAKCACCLNPCSPRVHGR
jgi:hypothetical protein